MAKRHRESKMQQQMKVIGEKMGRCREKNPHSKQSQSGFKSFSGTFGASSISSLESNEYRGSGQKKTHLHIQLLPPPQIKSRREKNYSVVFSFSCFSSLSLPPGFNSSRTNQRASFSILMSFFSFPCRFMSFFSVQRKQRERELNTEKFENCAEAPANVLVFFACFAQRPEFERNLTTTK